MSKANPKHTDGTLPK